MKNLIKDKDWYLYTDGWINQDIFTLSIILSIMDDIEERI